MRLREGAKKVFSFLPHVFLLRFSQHTTLPILSTICKFNIKKIAHPTPAVLRVMEHGKWLRTRTLLKCWDSFLNRKQRMSFLHGFSWRYLWSLLCPPKFRPACSIYNWTKDINTVSHLLAVFKTMLYLAGSVSKATDMNTQRTNQGGGDRLVGDWCHGPQWWMASLCSVKTYYTLPLDPWLPLGWQSVSHVLV